MCLEKQHRVRESWLPFNLFGHLKKALGHLQHEGKLFFHRPRIVELPFKQSTCQKETRFDHTGDTLYWITEGTWKKHCGLVSDVTNQKTRAESSYGTCHELRAKRSYGMSSNKFL